MSARSSGGFGDLVRTMREHRGLSQTELSNQVHIERTTLSKIENGKCPTRDQVDRLERVFGAEGALLDEARAEWGDLVWRSGREGAGLTVLSEVAELTYAGKRYHARIRRRLQNNGDSLVTSYLAKVSVDRYPEDSERSREHHHRHPLTMEAIGFRATLDGSPLKLEVKVDGPATKEIYLLFETPDGRSVPLHRGETAELEYEYTVPEGLWGRWFQRAIRLPTDELVIRVRLPSEPRPLLWGKEMSYERYGPIQVAPSQSPTEAGMTQTEWRILSPVLESRYRVAWNFASQPVVEPEVEAPDLTPAQQMAALGIVQEGDAALRRQIEPFELPSEAVLARDHLRQLQAALTKVELYYPFTKGSGLASNQLGLNRRAAVVRAPTGEIVHLINPVVVERSAETDTRYEGCLSLFDVRGPVTRPRLIEVQHQTPSGETLITRFEDALARLVSHEVDHLDGVLYTDLVEDKRLILPFEDYKSGRSPWKYD